MNKSSPNWAYVRLTRVCKQNDKKLIFVYLIRESVHALTCGRSKLRGFAHVLKRTMES